MKNSIWNQYTTKAKSKQKRAISNKNFVITFDLFKCFRMKRIYFGSIVWMCFEIGLDETCSENRSIRSKRTVLMQWTDRDASQHLIVAIFLCAVFVEFRFAHIAEPMDKFYWIRVIVFVKIRLIPNGNSIYVALSFAHTVHKHLWFSMQIDCLVSISIVPERQINLCLERF